MLKGLITAFIKQNGRKPNAIELLKLKLKASGQTGKEKVLKIPTKYKKPPSPKKESVPIFGNPAMQEALKHFQSMGPLGEKGIPSFMDLMAMNMQYTDKQIFNVLKRYGWKPKVVSKPKTDLKETEQQIKLKLERENKEAADRIRKKNANPFKDVEATGKIDPNWDPDPTGMASGGIARVGMFGGGLIKLKHLKKLFPRIHIDSLVEASKIKDPNKLKQLLRSFRKTEQYIDEAPSAELFNFDVTGRKPNASGGRAGFDKGGLLSPQMADYINNYSDQMTFEQYLQLMSNKKAKGGIARVGMVGGLLVKGSKAYKVAQKKKLIEFRKKYRPGFGRSWDDASIEEMDKILNDIKALGSLDDFVAEFFKQTGKKIKPKDLKRVYDDKLAYPHGTPIIDDTGNILGGSVQQKTPVDPTKFEVRGSNWPLDEPIDVVKKAEPQIGKFTKAEALIARLKNTIKESKDPYVQENFPNFIKEIEANPKLADNENVWKELGGDLPENQKFVVHSDDSVDFWTQSEFGPHNIEKTLEFQKKYNLSRDEAVRISKLNPEDKTLEIKRIETLADRSRTKHALGGIAGQLHLNRPGYRSGALVKLLNLLKGGKKKKDLYKHIDMEKLMKGKDKIKVYSGSVERPSNTWQSFIEDAKRFNTTPEKIAKDKFKDQWFTPFKSYAEGFTSPHELKSKLRTVELTPREIAIAKRYVKKINKTDSISMRKKLGLKPYPKHRVTTDENLVLIPRYKLKELEKSGRMKKDYMILEKLKKKMGLAKGGIAGQLHLNRQGFANGTNSPHYTPPDRREGILGLGITWAQFMEDFHPFSVTPGGFSRFKKDIIEPLWKEKLKWNELDDYYRQLEMDENMRDYESFPSRGELYAAQGGRVALGKGGPPNPGRRNFMKLMAGLASIPILGKFFKLAKPAAKALKAVETSNAAGMPAWFPKLVDKVIKDGTDVTKKLGTSEREIVHAAELPSGTKVLVTQDLTTGNTAVDIGIGKHGFSGGRYGQPTRLELTKGEWIEPTHIENIKKGSRYEKTGKPTKTKDEFWVEEAEFTGGRPENIKFEESSIESYGNHASDFSEVEKYATGKNVDKYNLKGTKKGATDEFAQGRAESRADVLRDADLFDKDFAKGGRVSLSNGGLAGVLGV